MAWMTRSQSDWRFHFNERRHQRFVRERWCSSGRRSGDYPGNRRRSIHPRDPETLISLPATEVISKQFQAGLRRLHVNWTTGVEGTVIDLIPIYTSLGFGVGVTIDIPGRKLEAGLKALSLRTFPPLVIAALWQQNLSASNAEFLAEIKTRTQEIQWQIPA